VLGLLAHASRHQTWLGWILRIIIGIALGAELLSLLGLSLAPDRTDFNIGVLTGTTICTALLLFHMCREGFSHVFTAIDFLVSGQFFYALLKKIQVRGHYLANKIFVPTSMPHMVALWVFVTSVGFLTGSIDPAGMGLPSMPIPLPVPMDQLLMYNGIGLVLLAMCGVGIVITRGFMPTITRLGWVKPTLPQVVLGIGLIGMTFGYDYVWSLFTHEMGGDLGGKLTSYNAGTFNSGGGAANSTMLALATGLCAGIGEETLIRGALQPVFGILPSAILHGLLHGQFSHAPIFIAQVAGWSALMGIVRRYTNTTTTMIGHVGFNFVTTFLFAFNP
jgi:hypothetical protein